MRKILLSIALSLLIGTAVSAAPLCTDVYGTNVLTSGFSCELGGLTFSSFSASQIGLGTAPIIAISSGVAGHQTGVFGSTVNLYFQTNFNSVTTEFRDISFAYTVTGGIIGVDGWMGGTGSARSIAETVYSDAAHNAEVASFTLTSGSPTATVTFAPMSTAYIFKDITLPVGATMSEFTQSFETPEPLTFVLIGSGLLGLGVVGRRRARR